MGADEKAAVRCCTDVEVPEVGFLVAEGTATGALPMHSASTGNYGAAEEEAVYEAQAQAAMLQGPGGDSYGDYGEGDAASDEGSTSGTAQSGSAAAAAAAVVVALVASVLVIGALVSRSRRSTSGSDEESAPRRESNGYNSTAAALGQATAENPEPAPAPVYEEPSDALSSNGVVYEEAGTIRFKSVRRANPAYTQSVYSIADVTGVAGIEEESEQ
jgi:hypothetical protein